MENNVLLEAIDLYKDLLDRKAELDDLTKENNKAIEDQKKKLTDMMVEAECPQVTRKGFSYSLQEKTIYSKKSAEKLTEEGLDFLQTLRDEGLGELIVETVNPRTLNSAINNYVEENDGLSEGLEKVLSVYETYDISKRKAKA